MILALWLRQRGDGWQVFDALQRDPATCQIPVIVCADDTLLLRADAAQPAGQPVAALEKPFDLDVLLDVVALCSPGACSTRSGQNRTLNGRRSAWVPRPAARQPAKRRSPTRA